MEARSWAIVPLSPRRHNSGRFDRQYSRLESVGGTYLRLEGNGGDRQASSGTGESRIAPAPCADRKHPAAGGILGVRAESNHAPGSADYRGQPLDGLEEPGGRTHRTPAPG